MTTGPSLVIRLSHTNVYSIVGFDLRALTAERLGRRKIARAPACNWLGAKVLYPYPLTNDPKHWRELARGARRVAEIMVDARARGHMIACAEAYERLAFRAQRDDPAYQKPQANDP